MLFVFGKNANRFSIIALLSATCVLWLTRLLFQVIYPQGSLYPSLQFGMLAAFALISLCYLFSLIFVVLEKNVI